MFFDSYLSFKCKILIAINDEDHKLGNVCISTLNWWKPEYKMREVLHNIYLLFYCQNPYSAYGTKKSKEYYDKLTGMINEMLKFENLKDIPEEMVQNFGETLLYTPELNSQINKLVLKRFE